MPNFHKKAITLAGAIAFASLSGCFLETENESASPAITNPRVTLGGGQVILGGWQDFKKRNINTYKGIRYGQAPTGPLRFAAPVANTLPAVTYASNFGSACPQPASPFGAASTNEDCLFLNVYTPAGENEDLPVMIWIHGGALVYGSGGSAYDPSRLVEEGVIVVTINYRLGALGFMAHSALTTEAGESGNYGLMDQRLAMQWVRNNIASFGGDANNITIFGESAGGHSVLSHIASPGSDTAFDKAIVQSGSYVGDQYSPTTAELVGSGIAATAGCTTPGSELTCLRGLSVSAVLTAQDDAFFLPVAGGTSTFLPKSISQAFTDNDFNNKPVILGANLNEGTLFTALDGPFFDETSYRTGVAAFFATLPILNANQIATDYLARIQGSDPVNPYVTYNLAYSAIYTDSFFTCTTLPQLTAMSVANDVYAYHFTDTASYNSFQSLLPYPMGASHTNEIQYVLNDAATFSENNPHTGAAELSQAMIDYWTNFAKEGDPNGSSVPSWDQYSNAGAMIELNGSEPTASSALEFSTTHNCAYWANPPLNI